MSYIDIWRKKNSQAGSDKQLIINQMTSNYEEYLANAPNSLEYEDYYDSKIKGMLTLLDEADGSGSIDKKSITTSITSELKSGSQIKIKADNLHTKCWLLFKEEQLAVNSHKKFTIYSCNQTINSKLFPQPMPCVADNTAYFTKGSIQGDYFIENDAKLKIYLPRNEFTEKIYVGMRFIFEHKACYEVTSEDIVVLDGLVSLTLVRSTIQAEDDLVNNIAFNPKVSEILPDTIPSSVEIQGESMIRLGDEFEYKLIGATNWEINDDNIADIVKIDKDRCIVVGKKVNYFKISANIDNEVYTKSVVVRR